MEDVTTAALVLTPSACAVSALLARTLLYGQMESVVWQSSISLANAALKLSALMQWFP